MLQNPQRPVRSPYGQIRTTKKAIMVDYIYAPWERITSPDGKISFELPGYNTLELHDDPELMEGYVYNASEQDGTIGYTVKYEDYQPIVEVYNSNIQKWVKKSDKVTPQIFLKFLAGVSTKNGNVKDFVTEFINIKGFNAIKYLGKIGNINIECAIIPVQETFIYSIAVVYFPGHHHNLKRVLDSLVII